ncbi:hypothetical protein [Flavobacterium lindanitolerans]|uniref:hypothetical protein n=1 Tax=Flavobacterium lindanitolerans TaxID=428988 RepID=UPI0027BA4105|nr:hypothetical protein [Flavobacterium lindanitolerans]
MKKLLLKIIILITILNGCRKSDIHKVDLHKVIQSTEILTFNDLTYSQKQKLEYCCYYYPNNWRDGIGYKKEDAYFVKAKIDNNLLAKLTESNAFSQEDLLNKNEFCLYGKYHNRWGFISLEGDTIVETQKFDGHRTLEIFRHKNIDEVIVGPLPKRPLKMYIKISNSKNYPNMTPEYKINQ